MAGDLHGSNIVIGAQNRFLTERADRAVMCFVLRTVFGGFIVGGYGGIDSVIDFLVVVAVLIVIVVGEVNDLGAEI